LGPNWIVRFAVEIKGSCRKCGVYVGARKAQTMERG
jgi:hypothetical protein